MMITKQERFKKLLAGHYKSINGLDRDLWMMMQERFYWSLTITDIGEDIAFKSVPGDFYIKSIYEDSLEWYKNVKAFLVKLGRI